MPGLFDLTGRVAFITGGAGLLGTMHAEAILEAGGISVLADIDRAGAETRARELVSRHQGQTFGVEVDVTDEGSIRRALACVLAQVGKVDILVNNAARNPKMKSIHSDLHENRFETFPLQTWNADVEVGLTGAFLCSRIIGSHMATTGGGVIVNIASDLGVIAPDQRIYRQPNVPEDKQPTKAVSYSVVKGGLIMLTKYLATYWADKNVRVNALSPGGIYDDHSEDFVARLTKLIPLGRMAERDEYKGALVFLCSNASSYMTGANLIIDGGRTCW
jgi:NAD(P)-dependent dehydrogenase (short-subunit alcohol dehydrogenase family)